MRISIRAGAAALAVALPAVTCSFPEDTSDQVYVVVYQSDSLLSKGVLGDGEEDFVVAKTYQLVGLPDTGNVDDIELHNVEYFWSTDNDNIVSVEPASFGGADVQGESPGFTTIRAKVVNFEGAVEGTTDIRVSGLFAVDSVTPDTVRYGEKVRFTGVRMGLVLGAQLGSADLLPDAFSFQGNPNGLSQLDFWVPYPASSDNVFYIGPGFFGFSTNVVTVLPYDLYEPNDSDIVDINVAGPGGPREVLGFPTLFFNPALFYEPPVNPWAEEWYRFTSPDTTQARTFIVTSRFQSDSPFTFLADSIAWSGGGFINLVGRFSHGADFTQCDGAFFSSGAARGLTTIHALRTLPQQTLQFFLASAGSGLYELTVVDGYLTADRRIGPDRFEEDDLWCIYSDVNFNSSTDSTSPNRKHIVVGIPFFQNGPWFDSTLTMDNPGDVDWIKFRVQQFGVADTMVTIRTKSLPLPGSFFDFSDINIYVLRSNFTLAGQATAAGSSEVLTLRLTPGDYYLGVADVTEQPTKYSLCMAKGNAAITCTPPGAAAAAALPVAPSVMQEAKARRVPVDPTVRPPGVARSPLQRP